MNTHFLLLLFALNAFLQSFLTLGLILGTATSAQDPVLKTSLLTGVQAISTLVALAATRSGVNLSLRMAAAMLTLTAIAASFLEPFSLVWYSTLLVASAISTYLTSRATAQIPAVFGKDDPVALKNFQMISLVSMAAAMSVGPIFVQSFGIPGLLRLVAGLSALALTLLGSLEASEVTPNQKPPIVIADLWNRVNIINLLTWSGVGLFTIVEVPMLKDRFDASPSLITAIFLVTLGMNVAFTRVSSIRKIASADRMVQAAALLLLLSAAYLASNSIPLVFVIVAAFGCVNAAFNLAQSALILRIDCPQKRARGFISLRLSTQIGTLLGVGFVAGVYRFGGASFSVLAAFCIVQALVIFSARFWPGRQ